MTKKIDWEKEFDKLFVRDDGLMDKYGWDEHGGQDVMANFIKSFIRSLLLSQHTQDMKAFKKAIPEKLTDATTTWGEVGNAGWNACRQKVLTKIEKM